MHRLTRARRRRRNQRGAAAVEFALICIPLIVLVFGLIQYGWWFYVAQTTSGAASNVVRRLEVGDCWTGTEAVDLARAEAPAITELSKTPTTLVGATPGTTQITVTVEADANTIAFLPMPNDGIVTRTVQARLEDTVSSSPCS